MKAADISSWQVVTAFLFAAALATVSLSSPPFGTCPRPGLGAQNCVSVTPDTPLTVARAEPGSPED